MKKALSFQIYHNSHSLPENWDDFAKNTVFLSKKYLHVLDDSAPDNMTCHYIGLFFDKKLVGIAVCQMIRLSQIVSFGENRSCLQSKLRNWFFQKFAKNALLIGNNMLTGQNAFSFDSEVNYKEALHTLNAAILELKDFFLQQKKKINITLIKDFLIAEKPLFAHSAFSNYYVFDVQPNMVFDIPKDWNTLEDYVAALSKKYRDQYKRSRRKAADIVKRKMTLDNICTHNDKIYELYLNVTKKAPFNTFYLHKNHFIDFKKKLDSDFYFYGYFIDNQMVGFNTLIKNADTFDTYFLGYDDAIQRNKMLYLNMLYDMLGYAIKKKYCKIVFARTALEIKSSVGAQAQPVFGLMQHANPIINLLLPKLFRFFEPKITWQERNPFKEN